MPAYPRCARSRARTIAVLACWVCGGTEALRIVVAAARAPKVLQPGRPCGPELVERAVQRVHVVLVQAQRERLRVEELERGGGVLTGLEELLRGIAVGDARDRGHALVG